MHRSQMVDNEEMAMSLLLWRDINWVVRFLNCFTQKTTRWGRGSKVIPFLNIGPIAASFSFISVFSMVNRKFVDDWIWTTDLCWKQTLCQLSHTHCPLLKSNLFFNILLVTNWWISKLNKKYSHFVAKLERFASFGLLKLFNLLYFLQRINSYKHY